MIKITALNETITDEDVEKYENNLTKEAQEQSAFNEYNKALKLLVDNKKDEALGVLQDVIKSKVLNDLEKLNAQVDQPRSMLTLKYSCLKNIAIIQADMKNYNDALYHFLEAIDIDDTDVMIWYKFGHLAIKMLNLDIACLAFKQALDRNVNHWPSLDNIISILYAIPDYKNCLLYISIALNRDPTYIKGLAFRDEIIKKFPSLNDCYKNIGDISDSFELSNNKSIADALIEEANELNKKWIKVSKIRIDKKKLPDIFLRKPLIKYTWLELGNSLFDTHKYIRDNKLSFISHINLSLSQNLSETSSTYQTEIIRNQNTYSFVSNKDIKHINSFDKSAAKEDAIEMESIEKSINLKNEQTYIKLLDNNISTVSQNNKYCITNKNIDEINDNLNLKKSVELTKINNNTYSENSMTSGTIDEKENSQKIKKRRRSSLCFLTQWAWSSNNTKRSSRGRTRKDFERDGLILQETIKQFIPSTLLLDSKLTKEELRKNMNDSTVGTMDTYNLIDNKENTSANEVTNSTNEYVS